MDQSAPKSSSPPTVEGMGEKRPWAAPTLKRLDVNLTNAGTAKKDNFRDGPAGIRS